MNAEAESAGDDKPRVGDWNFPAIYSLGFLCLISVFNYLDRAILGLALPLIKEEMQVSDTALGLVSGLAFVLFYAILGVPIAWAADRWNRRNIIAIGFAFWSVMTVATGFIANIWQLAIARFLMGAGEAAGLAPSNSMISDTFRRERRPLALAIFGTANSIAFIALFPIAGWIATEYGWRTMFVAAGLPGLGLALLFFFTVREPERGAVEDKPSRFANVNFRETIGFLRGTRTYLLILLGVTFMGANVFAAGAWTPTFLNRVHDMTIAEVATSIGPVRGVLGAVGILAGGLMIDRLGARWTAWRIRIPALACILVGPAEALFLLGDPQWLWLLGFGLTSFLTLIHQGPIYAATMNVVGVRMRALAVAILIFCASLLGQAVGPLAVGILNDALQPEFGPLAIRYSLLIIAITPVLAGICFWAAAASYRRDMTRAEGD
ncbi:spinster family MFS transporter [Parasphingopyxis marina]|uniref:MFS transporter n=1 Tax=Parasphingopyxis marina TaxID=2761622 RepID=A0A842I2E9_9SPHN|nr:MFS transporter [Parasphingopyxis marina]MBC2778899.1 MFS transporter [Parasphingopyxis marina]